MKITIRQPNGFEISFEGDSDEYDQFTGLLDVLPELIGTLPAGSSTPELPPGGTPGNGGVDPNALPGQIDVRRLSERLAAVGAATDIERATVMAQAAIEAKLPGVDYATAERLYDELGIPKPGKIRATFSNAKIRGYVRSVGQGMWAPTVAGENFAKYGQRRAGTGRRAPQLSIGSDGGDDD